ncbi:threonylcarbamoyl-AMP synthase [bacterium]|nr:threonylcarbamoyl-AMP synthase [bacterium]
MIVLNLQNKPQQISTLQKEQIRQVLLDGGVIAYPTDTLYGLGVDACSEEAVKRLFLLKERSNSPVSVLLNSIDQLFSISCDLPEHARELIRTFLPGALTVVCKSEYPFSKQLYSETGSIGFRIPSDNISKELPVLLGRPITTTSVNPAGSPPATMLAEIRSYYTDQVDLTIDIGTLNPSQGSTVIDLTTAPFKILRQGEISRHTLQDFIN